jgi:hypothetical protein
VLHREFRIERGGVDNRVVDCLKVGLDRELQHFISGDQHHVPDVFVIFDLVDQPFDSITAELLVANRRPGCLGERIEERSLQRIEEIAGRGSGNDERATGPALGIEKSRNRRRKGRKCCCGLDVQWVGCFGRLIVRWIV